MYDLRNLPIYKHLCAIGVVLLGALCPVQVEAGAFSSSSSGNSTTYASSTYGNDAAMAGAALAISGGAIYAAQSSTLRTAAGAAVLAVRAAPVAGAVGSAVLSCFGNPLCVGFVGASAIAVLAKEVNFNASVDPVSGLPVVTKQDPAVCTVAPCYEYWLDLAAAGVTPRFSTLSQASQAALPMLAAMYGNTWSVYQTTATWVYFTNPSGTLWSYGIQKASKAPSAATQIPATTQELAGAIGSNGNWADNSKIIELLQKIVKNTSTAIPLQVPTVTGPISIPGTPAVTTKADGSKTTTTSTSNLGYYGPTVTATTTTVVQDTTPAGATTTTTTTVAPSTTTEEPAKDEYDVPTDEIPKTKKTITFAAENLGFAGGSCPADVNKVIASKTVKLVDWTSNCGYVTTYAKPMILAMATFAALMIIFVGGKPE